MLSDVREQDEGVFFLRAVAERRFNSPLLLVGDEGVGRRFAVHQLAKELFCTGSRTNGCDCFACAQIDTGTHPDFVTVSPEDDKEIGVDAIRALIEDANAFPSMAPLKLFLIDGTDRMTGPAANAFLKTLEEPPTTARFFLLAEDANRVIPTIRSRCGLVRFRRLPESFVVSTVQQFESDPAKALVYARMGEGSVGRAVRFWGAGRLALRDRMVSLLSAGLQRDLPSIFSIVSSLEKDLTLGLRLMEQLLHDLLIAQSEPGRMINTDLSDTLQQMRGKVPPEVWSKLSTGLRVVQNRQRSRINLPFHVQTLFVETFIGV